MHIRNVNPSTSSFSFRLRPVFAILLFAYSSVLLPLLSLLFLPFCSPLPNATELTFLLYPLLLPFSPFLGKRKNSGTEAQGRGTNCRIRKADRDK